MAISQHADGSESVTGGTEQVIGTNPDTTDGVFQLWLELSDMVRTDELTVRIYEKIRAAGDTQRTVFLHKFKHAQTETMWASPTLILLNGWKVSLQANVGTITVQWSIRKVA